MRPDRPNGACTRFIYTGAIGNVNELDTITDGFVTHAKRIQNTVLDIYGDGPKRPAIQAKIDRIGMSDRVRFMGRIDRSQVPVELAASNWAVLGIANMPRLYSYGFSANKLTEYMAAGLPICMVGDFPGNPVREHDAGLVVDGCSTSRIADQFTDAHQAGWAAELGMGIHAQDFVRAQRLYENYVPELAAALDVSVRTSTVRGAKRT